MKTTKHRNLPTLRPELIEGKRRKFIAARPIKDPKDAEAYAAPLPQPSHKEKNEMDEAFQARMKRYEMFLIINVDPFEGKFP
jgi:hypothetical protein